MLNVNPNLQKITHSITGGALKGQGPLASTHRTG
jgi:hypothetical protein